MDMNRRRMLQVTAGLGAVSLASRRRSVRAESDRMVQALQQAAAMPVLARDVVPDPVIIESIELLRGKRDSFIRVRSRDGAEGISVTNSRAAYLHPILKRLIIPYFIGKDARDLEDHLWEIYRYRSNYKLQGLAFWCPLAWVEFALLDMLGRIAGKSLGELLGGRVRNEVPFYVASGRRDSTPEEEVAYLQRLIDETGATAVKFRVGGRMSRNADAMPGRTKRLIPLARKTLSDEMAIHADANSSYDPTHAIEVGRALEGIGAIYFEEPCPFDHLEETRRVTEALTIPVAGGEQEFSQRRFRWSIENRVVDIVQPDLQYYGGLIRSIRVARMAAVAKMPTTVHISGGFGFVYMLHFASRTPDIGRFQEYKREIDRYRDWFDPPLAVHAGALSVPTGPGVGIVDPGAVLKGCVKVA